MSAPVLTLPLSVGCYDGTTIMDANGKQVAGSEDITLAASIVAAVNESASLRAECEAVRADRDSLWTTVNKVKAERDAALAEVARLKGVALAAYRLTRGKGIDGDLLADLCSQLIGFKVEDFGL